MQPVLLRCRFGFCRCLFCFSFLPMVVIVSKLEFEKGWGTFRSSYLFMWPFCLCHRFMQLLIQLHDNEIVYKIKPSWLINCAIYSCWIHSTCTICSISPLQINFIKLSVLISPSPDWRHPHLPRRVVITSQSDGRQQPLARSERFDGRSHFQ